MTTTSLPDIHAAQRPMSRASEARSLRSVAASGGRFETQSVHSGVSAASRAEVLFFFSVRVSLLWLPAPASRAVNVEQKNACHPVVLLGNDWCRVRVCSPTLLACRGARHQQHRRW